ncbi:unnamed protein product [Linum trigynum]|uniref:Uncharacterized protein n=1 Tax=Linum trigynum TaxID=586398 RepID=A0AAV2D0F9_9ROSI
MFFFSSRVQGKNSSIHPEKLTRRDFCLNRFVNVRIRIKLVISVSSFSSSETYSPSRSTKVFLFGHYVEPRLLIPLDKLQPLKLDDQSIQNINLQACYMKTAEKEKNRVNDGVGRCNFNTNFGEEARSK